MKLLGKKLGLCLFIFLFLCPSLYAKTTYTPVYDRATLASEINRIVSNSGPNATIGVVVKSMKNGEILFARNDKHLFVPASTAKILTAEAALLYLGPEFKFPTAFLTDAANPRPVNGVLDGNVYLVHSGDPTLTFYDFIDLMVTLKAQQIQEITGNVFIDMTAYDAQQVGPGWDWRDSKYCYAAPISASIINHNCLTFKVTPNKSGQLATIVGSPNYYYTGIQNKVITKNTNSRSCYIHLDKTSDSTISVSGCLAKGKYTQGASTVITDVAHYNQSMLRDLFNRFQIRIDGNIMSGIAPNNLKLIANHESKPLHSLINEMLKMSDNIIAGSLFKKIGAMHANRPGTWANGSTAVTQILARIAGVDTWRLNIIDGSGLSRYNQVTPSQMMQVLDFAFHHYATNYEFISSLPIAGVDGTLKRRLKNIAWKVRAKTGTMSGVVSLAGYALAKNKEPIAFVIMVNGQNGLGWKYKEWEDQIVTAITKYNSNN